jgi:hypothetical protein
MDAENAPKRRQPLTTLQHSVISHNIRIHQQCCKILSTAFVYDKIFALPGYYAVLIGGYRRFEATYHFYLQGSTSQRRNIILGGGGTFGGPGQLSRYSDSLRAGRSGDRIPVEARFSAPVQTGPGAHPAFYTMGTESFLGVNRPGRGVDHTPNLAPR